MPIAARADSPLLRRLATLGVGLLLVGVGVALTITAELGVAPYDVLTTGLVSLTGMPLGVAAMILPLAFVVVGVALGRRPGLGTLLAVLLVGPILGLAMEVMPALDAMAPRLGFVALGFACLSAGITLVVVAEVGPGPAELVMLALHDRGHPLAPARTAIEITCVVVGWAMGGQVGAGTVVIACLIGVTLRWMLALAGYQTGVVAEVDPAADDVARAYGPVPHHDGEDLGSRHRRR